MRRLLTAVFVLCSLASAETKATRIVVLKKDHKLQLFAGDRVLKTYSVALGRGGLEPKQFEGDHKTPEGGYILDRRKPNSSFHRALHISYPNDSDRERARKAGKSPGGDIMIHGITNGLGWIGALHRKMDWTDGCIAVTDQEIEEIWELVPDGTPIEIKP